MYNIVSARNHKCTCSVLGTWHPGYMVMQHISSAGQNSQGDHFTKLSRVALITASSSAKLHGPEFLIDGNPDTYWQSDGALPHYVNIKISRRINIRAISVKLSFSKDDSYAPMEIEVYAGTCSHDLCKVAHEVAFQKSGVINVYDSGGNLKSRPYSELELVITGNNEGGRDTRIRGIEIYGIRTHVNIIPKMDIFR